MSTSTEPVTFSDLQTDFMSRAGIASNATSLVLAKRALNTSLVNMHQSPGSKYPWAERRGTLITHAPYSDGTVDIAAATRTTVAGTTTLWNTAVTGFGFNNARVGGKMTFNGLTEVYEVSAVTNDTSITLGSVYTGDALTTATYIYFEDEYALAADFLRFVDLRKFSEEMNIPLIGRSEFRRNFPRNDTSGKPRCATTYTLDFSGSTTPVVKVVLHPYPDDEYSIPYWYCSSYLAVTSAGVRQRSLVDDSDEPIVPREKRYSIVLYALYEYYRDYKDDLTRSGECYREFVDLMVRYLGEHDRGADKPQFIVRKRRDLRRQRYSTDSRFDEILDR